MSRIPRIPNGPVRQRRIERRVTRLEHRGPDRWVYIGTYDDDAFTTPDSPEWKNSWDNAASNYDKVAFRADLSGRLEFKGTPSSASATSGTVAFTLPEAWRPGKDMSLPATVYDGTALRSGRWDVDASTGDVTITTPDAQTLSGGAGGWPTMHNLLYGVQGGNDRYEDTGLGLNSKWRTFADTTKYGTFKWQNSDDAGTTFYDASFAYFGMMLGPKGSCWGLYNVGDQRTDGGNVQFKWATDPLTDGLLSDPTSLTYYDVTGNTASFNGSAVTFESGLQFGFRLNGDDGDQLTANMTVFDSDQTNVRSSTGGAGFWWLKLLTSDGGTDDFAVVLRDLRVIRLADAGAVN